MPIKLSDVVEVAQLRHGHRDEFRAWDRSVDARDTRAAKAARKVLQRVMSERLAEHPAAALPGIYVFASLTAPSPLGGVNYVGIAKGGGRPIAGRIRDRLRDDSCLDTELDGSDEGGAATKIDRRLRI